MPENTDYKHDKWKGKSTGMQPPNYHMERQQHQKDFLATSKPTFGETKTRLEAKTKFLLGAKIFTNL